MDNNKEKDFIFVLDTSILGYISSICKDIKDKVIDNSKQYYGIDISDYKIKKSVFLFLLDYHLSKEIDAVSITVNYDNNFVNDSVRDIMLGKMNYTKVVAYEFMEHVSKLANYKHLEIDCICSSKSFFLIVIAK